jgi:hypothetical protein
VAMLPVVDAARERLFVYTPYHKTLVLCIRAYIVQSTLTSIKPSKHERFGDVEPA